MSFEPVTLKTVDPISFTLSNQYVFDKNENAQTAVTRRADLIVDKVVAIPMKDIMKPYNNYFSCQFKKLIELDLSAFGHMNFTIPKVAFVRYNNL